jgi:hypothetical protein
MGASAAKGRVGAGTTRGIVDWMQLAQNNFLLSSRRWSMTNYRYTRAT